MDSLSSFNLLGLRPEMLGEVCKHLPIRDLANFDQVNTQCHEIASDIKLPLQEKKTWMDIETVRANIQVLWMFPEGNFDVSDDGALTRISDWNLFGRFFKWIREWWSDGGVTKRVHEVADLTLREAYLFSVIQKRFFTLGPTYCGNDTNTINSLACRLYHSSQFSSISQETFDLFKKPLFYGWCRDFQDNVVVARAAFYECHKNPYQGGDVGFHQALYSPPDNP